MRARRTFDIGLTSTNYRPTGARRPGLEYKRPVTARSHSLSQQRTHAAAIHFFPFWLCTEEAESLIRYPALTMQDRHAILALIKPMVLSPIGSVLSPDPRRTFITWCFTVVYPATRLLLV